ncbi:3-isopropylmalate dehydrogenase [Abditibacterium utsteinense]|uniref:3-isopropylmalate dehydrogenase n=1 Tax=Abditibacterium utsteinense TaxID=1960156 RepID=A0A2S8SX36_9BACT|nr:3-isopropylmalate dehydrogenase [Abditibacterium utsteinense]PQV65356.1 3-isopropylmalate dehydrogenase [Abditibacterium utsteinense]
MNTQIGVIEGDGVGPEVVKWGIEVLKAASKNTDLNFEFVSAPVGGTCFLEDGKVLPEKSLEILRGCRAVLKGPMGRPDIEAGVVERDGILALRQLFGQYVNIRPVKLFKGLENASPLKDKLLATGVDFVIIRENSEGLYARMGGANDTTATDVNLATENGVNRILKFAFELAKKRDKRLISVDKANVLSASLFWRKKFEAMSAKYPEIKVSSQLVDSWCLLVLQDPSPAKWDVIVTDNLFGDIISDEAAAIVGSLGMSPSANFNPNGISMFEPVHGSAPDIAGQGIVNPLATILACAMMMRFAFEREDLAQKIESAVQSALDEGFRTKDICAGNPSCTTQQMGEAVLKHLN